MDNEKNYELTDRELINFLAEERMAQLADIYDVYRKKQNE